MTGFDHTAGLIAPAAVRLVDLDATPTDLELWSQRFRIPYRSLLAVARFEGEPLGVASVPVGPDGRIRGDWLDDTLLREFDSELDDVLGWRDDDSLGAAPRERTPRRSPNGKAHKAVRRSVSVVVTTRRDPMRLERCLRSILACDYPDFEVIVVERRPGSDNDARMTLDARFRDEPLVRYVTEPRAGLSRARNAGLACAEGDVALFAEDDVVVDRGWVRRGAEAFDGDDDVAAVTGLVLPLELETEGQLCFERSASFVRGFRRRTFRPPETWYTHPFFYYTPGVIGSGANTALRIDVARQLGGFDTMLGPGTPTRAGEDVDLYVRILRAGHAVLYDPSVIVWHEHPERMPRARRQVLRQGVGLGAALAKQFATGPERRSLLRGLPVGLRYELYPTAPREAHTSPGAQRGVERLGRLGLAIGPGAYAASVLRMALAAAARSWALGGRGRTASRSERALFAVAAAACVLALTLVAAGVSGQLRLPAVLALLCLAPGTVLLSVLGRSDARLEPGLVLGLSLAVSAVLAQSMLWFGAWSPKAWLYVLAVACLPPLLGGLRTGAGRKRKPATAGTPPEASRTWVTDLELGAPLSDLRTPLDPAGPRYERARILVRLHRQPIGFVELSLAEGSVSVRDLLAAVDEHLSAEIAAHLERDGLDPLTLTAEGLPTPESPLCAAPGFYGENAPFVSVIPGASAGTVSGTAAPCLRSLLAVDYPSFEVVVPAEAGQVVRDPRLRYAHEPVAAARGDVLAFVHAGTVVTPGWLNALVRGLSPAARVGCVTGPVVRGDGPDVNFAVSRQALRSVGALEGNGASTSADGRPGDALMERLLLAGWAVTHEPAAMGWRLTPQHGGGERRRTRDIRSWIARHIGWLVSPGAHVVVLVAAIALWALSLRDLDLNRMAGHGLLDALPPGYFVAFGLVVAGFVAAISRQVLSKGLLWVYVVALILVIHGTTPLLYEVPRYTWTFKHLGVIALIAHTGAVDRSVDIYNNWPGFFALTAWLSSVTGLSAIHYAAWAQVFFNLAAVLALRFALRGVTSDERLLWTATLFFVLGNWVAQDYLAPQAFAFVLSLIVVGLCLRSTPAPVPARSRVARRWTSLGDRLRGALVRGAPPDPPPPTAPLSPRAAILVGGLCYLAVVVSHPLTPVIVLAGVTALAAVGRRVPLWVPLAMLAVEAWWLSRSWPYLSLHFSLFDPALTTSAVPPGYHIGDGLPGLALTAYAVRAEFVIIALVAGAGVVRRLRTGRWDLAAAVLLVAPLSVVALQSYSGEARYRVYLFALPWLCFFAASACAPIREGRRATWVGPARLVLASAGLGVCLLFAYFGLELTNHVDPGDVAAATWFERHAPSDSLLVGATGSFPQRLTARYAAVYDPAYPGPPSLIDYAPYRRRARIFASAPLIEKTLRAFGARHTYVALGPTQERFARLYGVLPPGSMRTLDRVLRTSPDFRVVYRRGASSIFAEVR